MRTTLVLTMAGAGQRFRDAGYPIPKYEIVVRGQTLFAWSMHSLRSWIDDGCDAVFVVRDEAGVQDFVRRETQALGIDDVEIITVPGSTDGQATSALMAGEGVRAPSQPMLVYNIDTHVRPLALRRESVAGDGWIPCFPGAGDHWSFARADDGVHVDEVREKQRISPHATVGLYAFSSFELYGSLYAEHFRAPSGMEAGERYIAPMYNTLIRRGGDVRIGVIPAEDVVPLGTPADVVAATARLIGS